MEPNTIRLPPNTWDALEEEASEYDFRNRSEYIRHLIERRDAIFEANTQSNTQADNLSDLQDRLADFEERLAELEDVVATQARSEPRDPSRRGQTAMSSPQPTESAETAVGGDPISDVLDEWTPARGPGERREAMRAAGRAAVELLQEDGGPLQRAEFEELWETHPVPDQAPPSQNDTYWRKSLRPALQAAIEADLARQAQGSWEYYWQGDDDLDREVLDEPK